jgi:putative transposase
VTAPREILPGQTYLVTRRCTQRQFLLTPTARTNQSVQYCLALALEQTEVVLNAVCVMSNHWHGVVTDRHARLPQFLGRFHGLLAKAQNASLGRWENLWSSERAGIVQLTTAKDVIAKMAYTIANPTTAGLVEAPEQWPGVLAWTGRDHGLAGQKPTNFFASAGSLPESVTTQLVRPAILANLSVDEFSRRLNAAINELVVEARDSLAQRDLKFLGPEAVRAQSFTAKPSTPALHREINPTVAARSTSARIRALEGKNSFVRAHEDARRRFRDGARDVKFPPGTYAMRLNSAVKLDEK